MRLTIQYLVLLALIVICGGFAIGYHVWLFRQLKAGRISRQDIMMATRDEFVADASTPKEDLEGLYQQLLKKFDPAKTNDKKNHKLFKQKMLDIKAAYVKKDLAALKKLAG